jgi:streptogramin lyase
MGNFKLIRLIKIIITLTMLTGLPLRMATGGELQGNIKSASGDSLYGIVVTAREENKTYATSVFTDDNGDYIFPPLESGKYSVWAQAAGFTREESTLQLSETSVEKLDFMLSDFEDIGRQLTGSEWIANLPEDTKENHRMKLIFRNNCSGCHIPNFVLQNQFDKDGWRKIVTAMETLSIFGQPPHPDSRVMQLIRQYREELSTYLAKIRGPEAIPLELKPFPRPRGEAARVVITEYDYTSGLNGEYVTFKGSDWTEGVPSVYQSRGPHDVEPDPYGYVWVADSQVDTLRTIARLDPRTGEVKNYKVPGNNGMAAASHGLVIDQKGHAWLNADGAFVEIDPKTDIATYFKPPEGVGAVGGTLDVDNNGIIWASSRQGAVSYNPSTRKFTDYKSKIPTYEGRTYGVAVDSLGNGWWAQMAISKLGIGDGRTGEVTELSLAPVDKWDHLMTEDDKELFNSIGSDWNSATPWAQGPRRLGAEKNGNYVWVADYWGNNLARIDNRTHEVTHIDYPNQKAFPGIYDTTIDKNGMVWMNMMNADTVARYNPKTDQWTEFRLPTLGTESRFIAVDNYKDQIEVWVPSYRTNKIMRIQFRNP